MNKPVQVTKHETHDFMLRSECTRSHNLLKWTITTLFACMTVMLAMVGYAARASATATDATTRIEREVTTRVEKRVDDVENHLEVYVAEDKTQAKMVIDMLSEIKIELQAQRAEQKRLFEKILQVDKLPK